MPAPPFQMSTTQKIQVSLIYHFASIEYLKGLHQRLQALMASIDPAMDLAKLQNRDALLTDKRWGTRNTSGNWANNGWPFARTGVYLPLDDPHGTPQFCWTGAPAGRLLECSAFNDLGLEALAAVGRSDLRINNNRMHAFVQNHLNDPRLTKDPFFTKSASNVDLAPSLVARNAFTSRPCSWIYVEQVHGEAMDWSEENVPPSLTIGE